MQLLKKISVLIRRRKYERELQEEMAFHREESAGDYRERGFEPGDARSAAAREFGNATRMQEQSVETVAFRWEATWHDFRYALRQLRQNPGFAATAIVILALGIGATTAIFSAVNPILFASLPYPHPRQIVTIYERNNGGGGRMPNFADYVGLSERSRSFDAMAATRGWQPTITGGDQPERLEGQRVSWPYFRVLGVAPFMGRDFESADDQWRGQGSSVDGPIKGPMGRNVVVLSYGFWRRRFAGDPNIIGRNIKLDDTEFTVIGVMPASFENVIAPEAELWAPLQYNSALPRASRDWGHHLRFVARLRVNITRAQAGSELDVIARTLSQIYAPGYNESGGAPQGYMVKSLQDDLTSSARPALLAVLSAVMLLLIIACVNVTNLLLARGAQRRTEFAMRAALGAARIRLLRQLMTESLVLALLGGAFGLLVAALGVRALILLSPPGLPRLNAIRIDGTVFAFALGVTALIGMLIGIIPALRAARSDPHESLQQSSARATGSRQWTRRALVIAEVSLAMVLLVSAGLLVRSLQRLFSVNSGFDAAHLITLRVQESGLRYRPDDARVRFFQEALQRVREVPGVESAAFTSQLPLSGDQDVYGSVFEKDLASARPDSGDAFFRYAVTPGYIETMRIPLIHGRLLNESDRADISHYCFRPQVCGATPASVLISQSFAKRKFGSADPIGQRVRLGPAAFSYLNDHIDTPWSTIVGVVGDVRQLSLAGETSDAIYVANSQWFWGDQEMALVVRTHVDPEALVPGLRKAIWSVDKDQPIVHVSTMEHLIAQSEAQRRFAMIIFEAFALVALVLAATGIYGVLAGSVSERTREIGIRSALGATRSKILALVLRQGMSLACIGVALGLAGALFATRALITLLFGISRLDPMTYAGVMVLLAAVSAVACWLPAWRAAAIDPAITLRAE